jgi:hypothetical protein
VKTPHPAEDQDPVAAEKTAASLDQAISNLQDAHEAAIGKEDALHVLVVEHSTTLTAALQLFFSGLC